MAGGRAGTIQDRFTHSTVVITAPGGSGVGGPLGVGGGGGAGGRLPKGGRELQLPSMGALTSKMSSQAFFLRVLKVVIQLREAALGAAAAAAAGAGQQQQAARRRRELVARMAVPLKAEGLLTAHSGTSPSRCSQLACVHSCCSMAVFILADVLLFRGQ